MVVTLINGKTISKKAKTKLEWRQDNTLLCFTSPSLGKLQIPKTSILFIEEEG